MTPIKTLPKDLDNFILNLMTIKGFGNAKLLLILEKYGDVFNFFQEKKYHGKFLPFNNLINKAKVTNTELLDLMEKHKINIKYIFEDSYPKLLKEIYSPPFALFYKGEWDDSIVNRTISVVGTRVPTQYGIQITRKLIEEVSDSSLTIVSGMAMGIDTWAHKSALSNGLKTIAVLGSSLDDITPKSNINLHNEIIKEGGLVISETLPGTETVPGLFASRNRLIAGISLATVVVEAPKKSGALITADLAFENNRIVLAVPGNAGAIKSEGTNNLIKESKAKLISCGKDILFELGFKSISNDSAQSKLKVNPISLSKQEQLVYDALIIKPMTLDELSNNLNTDLKHVITLCSGLELKGIISKDERSKFNLLI